MEWTKRFVGKRFLLILDYVWNEYPDKWDRLKQALRSGRRGSEVIVTTRLEKVAFIMAKIPFHCLLCLSDVDSWSLFKKRAIVMGINEGNVNHETIGKQIAQRCGGVPLAINAIRSILCFKSQESEWLRVKDSEIWGLEDEGKRILAVLSKFIFHGNLSSPSHFFNKQKYLKVWVGYSLSNTAFESLKQLRYLDLRECDALASMPVGLGQLSCLRNLRKFVVGKDNGCGIDECDQLPPLGKLRFLEVLTIRRMDALKHIGSSFYGDMGSSFPSLELEIGGINVTLLKSLMMTTTVLTSLEIWELYELTDLLDRLLQNQKHLDSLTIVPTTLKSSSDLLNNLSTLTHLCFQCWEQDYKTSTL
ncbi:disease resistance protein RGA2-like [Gossypium australe]|uniref:Disease resistance protein RGA2-like n=1 Tax=Gossypium australe TaxID=47621 RepID=A0A5B6VYW2_9ROSI|nr:disease resistance protein RGA2-like [Gossypium australe]